MRKGCYLIICMALLLALTAPVFAVKVDGADDITVRTNARYNNTSPFGLFTKNMTTDRAYIKFTLPNVTVSKAYLYLYNYWGKPQGKTVNATMRIRGHDVFTAWTEAAGIPSGAAEETGWGLVCSNFVVDSTPKWYSPDITSWFNTYKGKTVTISLRCSVSGTADGPIFTDKDGTAGDGYDSTYRPYIIYCVAPTAPTSASNNGPICSGSSATLSYSGGSGDVLRWYSGSCGGTLVGTGNNVSVSPTSTTTYYARWETNAPCSQVSSCASTTVTVNAVPGAVSVSGGGTYCGSATLNASGGSGGTIYFQGMTSGGTSTADSAISKEVTSSGTYYFRARSAEGCWGAQGSATVTINAVPAAVSVSGDGSYCGSTTLDASGGSGGTIYFQGMTSGGTSTADPAISKEVTSSGTYYFRSRSTEGCWGSEGSATVTIVNAAADRTVTAEASSVCSSAGTNIQVAESEIGVSYQLKTEAGVAVGAPVVGDGDTIDLPTGDLTEETQFKVEATRSPCSAVTMTNHPTVSINPATEAPADRTVSAEASTVCSGTGTNILVEESEVGVSYQLKTEAGAAIGDPVVGDGDTIDLPTGDLTETTQFKVEATRSGTCGDETITLTNHPTVTVDAGLDGPDTPGYTNVAVDSIRWTWQDNSANETGFNVYADPGDGPPTTLQTTTEADVVYWDYTGLEANSQYAFQVSAVNDCGESAKTANLTAYTMAGPPQTGENVSCDKSTETLYPASTQFTFSNPAGFGTSGAYKVSKFKYAWDKNAAYVWTGSESDWSSGDLVLSPEVGDGSYYLHLLSYNADGESNPSGLDFGPFDYDGTPPTVTIDQALGQDDPTSDSPINFTVVFSEPVTGFTYEGVELYGTAGATTAEVTGGPETYNVAVSGMTQPGTVIANIPAGVAYDAAGNANTASTSTDNEVEFEDPCVAPEITLQPENQEGVIGGTATFAVEATGTQLSYKWQIYSDPDWVDVDGATNSAYTTPALGASDDGSIFRCVVSNACGEETSETAVLTIESELEIIVVLDGITEGTFARQIALVIADGGPAMLEPIRMNADLDFVDGVANEVFRLPAEGVWSEVSAKDEQHTLRSLVDVTKDGAVFVADFTEAPLLGGDANNDNLIDILDFGIFAGQWGLTGSVSAWPVVDADFSCNGLVWSEDFSFIFTGFLEVGAEEPAENVPQLKASLAVSEDPTAPRKSISLTDLAAIVGWEAALRADANQDGVIDIADMKRFFAE